MKETAAEQTEIMYYIKNIKLHFVYSTNHSKFEYNQWYMCAIAAVAVVIIDVVYILQPFFNYFVLPLQLRK